MIKENTLKINEEKIIAKNFLKFFIPSLLGLIIFLLPIKNVESGGYTLIIGFFCQKIEDDLVGFSQYIVLVAVLLSAIGTIFFKFYKTKVENNFIENTFITDNYNFIGRIVGGLFFAMVLFNFGPGFVLNENIGPVMLDLCILVAVWLVPALILVPLMVEYGLMEFIGTLLNKLTRPMFKLPGRSTVDLLTSWVGMIELGLVITNNQYQKGYYSKRETAIIASCFTTTGVAFWLVCGEILGLTQYILQFYLTIFISGFVSVIIMARIPPLSTMPDSYYKEGKSYVEETPTKTNKLKYAVLQGIKKTQSAKSIKELLKDAVLLIINLTMTLVPIIMCFGVIFTALVEYTPIFNWLAIPFEYYLKLLGVPEAHTAAPATIIGFTDMFIPILLSTSIASTKTRFIIGVLALTQVVFMTETGAYILISKIPLKFKDLLIIFIEKTIIILPIIVLLSNILKIPA